MKRTVSILCALLITMSCASFAYAEDTATDTSQTTEQTVKGANKEAKAELKAKKMEIASTREDIKSVRAEKQALKAEYKELRAAVKADPSMVSEETLAKVNAIIAENKELKAAIDEGKGVPKEAIASSKENKKAKEFESAAADLDTALGVLETRLDTSAELTAAYGEIIDLLK